MAATATMQLQFRPVKALTETAYDRGLEYPVAYTAAFTHVSGGLVAGLDEVPPQIVVTTLRSTDWIEPTVSAMSTLMQLDENWDSYGGRPTQSDVVRQALLVLGGIMDFQSPAPSVVPLSDGGLQLEWHRKQQDLEIVFPVDSPATFYYRNRRDDAEREGTVSESAELANLIGKLA